MRLYCVYASFINQLAMEV